MNPASTSLTLFRPLNRCKHKDSNSRDSKAHAIHSVGGSKYLQAQTKAMKYLLKAEYGHEFCS